MNDHMQLIIQIQLQESTMAIPSTNAVQAAINQMDRLAELLRMLN